MVVFISSCDSKSKLEKTIGSIPVDLNIVRFDTIFAHAEISGLPQLKKEFPFFFPESYADSIWEMKLGDTLQAQLEEEVMKVFPNNDKLEVPLVSLFQHIQYYVPKIQVPRVYTTTSDVDYRNSVFANDTLLILALDNYLGSDHFFYEGISKYISKEMKPSQLMPNVASVYARHLIVPSTERTFLAQMIYYGKELYLKDLWLPEVSDSEKIGYTEAEIAWAEANETEIWRYFVENELLFSTDPKLSQRFILPAPFSKFNLEIDNESPGMIGKWVGWQIVRSYMKERPVSINQLLQKQPSDIFQNSKYKPKK